ncbi:hypothetical protein ACKKBF_B33685 [Auxenochlorella protothecoides x Auxenochlorella symbiontica]
MTLRGSGRLARRLFHTRIVPLEQQLEHAATVLQLLQVPGQGRGLFATQAIPQNTLVHREAPMLCTPPPCLHQHAACAGCLAPGSPSPTPWICQACQEAGLQGEPWWRLHTRCDWGPLQALCSGSGDKFPLLMARLACMRLRPRGPERGEEPGAGPLRSPPPARGDPLSDLQHLCHARVPPPPPEPWREQHAALLRGLAAGLAGQAAAVACRALDLAWYSDGMSRLHLNVFRVDTISMHGASLLQAAAASLGGGPVAAPGAGSAVYALASLFNHSCDPCLDVQFPGNNALLTLRAARDVDAGEQLTISYVDVGAGVTQRQRSLHHAYGFRCRCARCVEEGAGSAGD